MKHLDDIHWIIYATPLNICTVLTVPLKHHWVTLIETLIDLVLPMTIDITGHHDIFWTVAAYHFHVGFLWVSHFPLTAQKLVGKWIGYSDLALVRNSCIRVCIFLSMEINEWIYEYLNVTHAYHCHIVYQIDRISHLDFTPRFLRSTQLLKIQWACGLVKQQWLNGGKIRQKIRFP